MTDTTTTASTSEVSSRHQTLLLVSRYGTLAAFFLLLVFNIAVTPNFLAMQTLYVNLTQVAPIVIVAVGMTLVIATGGIDLSVGSLMAISGAIAPMIGEGPAAGLAANYRAMAALPGRVIAPERSAQKLLGVTPRTPSEWLADMGVQ